MYNTYKPWAGYYHTDRRPKVRFALRYRKRGLSVIPIRKNKEPYVPLEEFQKRLAGYDEIREWWNDWPSAHVALVTGRVSNLVVIEVNKEKPVLDDYIPDSMIMPCTTTPEGGYQLYFACPSDLPDKISWSIPGCVFRGEGSFVIVPPSKMNGKFYKWTISLLDHALPPLPFAP